MTKLAAIALLFLAGVLLRRLGWLDARHGTRLLRIVATLGLPALIIGTVGRVPMEAKLLALPASAAAVMLAVGVLARAAARLLGLDRPATGALIVSAMAMNLAFVFPFVFLAWGPEALTRTVVFDAGNAVTQWTLVYLLAARYGGHAADARAVMGRLARAPPFLAIVAALLVNRFAPPEAAGPLDVLRIAGQAVTLLVVPAMGLLFEARRIAAPEVVAAVALRCGAGCRRRRADRSRVRLRTRVCGGGDRRQRRPGRIQRRRHGGARGARHRPRGRGGVALGARGAGR